MIDPCLRRHLLVALLLGALALSGCTTSDEPESGGGTGVEDPTDGATASGVSPERAEQLIQGFYDGQDPSPVMDAIAPGSIDRSVAPDVAQGLSEDRLYFDSFDFSADSLMPPNP